jgi:hypothetical protein
MTQEYQDITQIDSVLRQSARASHHITKTIAQAFERHRNLHNVFVYLKTEITIKLEVTDLCDIDMMCFL